MEQSDLQKDTQYKKILVNSVSIRHNGNCHEIDQHQNCTWN